MDSNLKPHLLSVCPFSKLPIHVDDKWKHFEVFSGYEAGFYLIGRNIFVTHLKGNPTEDGTLKLYKLRKDFLTEKGLWDKPFIELRDYTEISPHFSKAVRLQFSKLIYQERERGCMRAFLGFNASLFIRSIMNVGKRIYEQYVNYPIGIEKDYETAIKHALQILESDSAFVGSFNLTNPQMSSVPVVAAREMSATEVEKGIHELMHLVGLFSWGHNNFPHENDPQENFDEKHPFRILYEAITILQHDFAELLRDRDKTQREMWQTTQLASLGQLVAGITHEMTNPLAVIHMNIENAKECLEKNREVLGDDFSTLFRSISIQEKNIQRMVHFLNSLKNHAYIDVEKLEQINLHDVVRETTEMVDLLFRNEGVRVEFELEARRPFLLGNTGRLQQILINLLNNAKDATSLKTSSGKIIVRTRNTVDRLVLEIVDLGCGMSPQVLEKVFETFFTTKQRGKGSGLGMGIVKSFVHQMQGEIFIESQEREGTKVKIEFPFLPRQE